MAILVAGNVSFISTICIDINESNMDGESHPRANIRTVIFDNL